MKEGEKAKVDGANANAAGIITVAKPKVAPMGLGK